MDNKQDREELRANRSSSTDTEPELHCETMETYVFDSSKRDGYYNPEYNEVLGERYKIIGALGKGSFGEVVKTLDILEDVEVAVKILKKWHTTELCFHRETFNLRSLRLQFPEAASTLLNLYNVFEYKNHYCIVFELLYKDVEHELDKTGNTGFGIEKVKSILRSLLETLIYFKKFNLTHCDLKPSNLAFVKKNCYSIKVIDYGNCTTAAQEQSTYAQTRFYRSPEVILRLPYGPPADMWSFGCIAVELMTGVPLFNGECELDQLPAIMEVLGAPPSDLLEKSRVADDYFTEEGKPRYCMPDNSRPKCRPRGPPGSKLLTSLLKGKGNLLFFNFIHQCFSWYPEARHTPTKALKHPWLAELDKPSENPSMQPGPSSAP